MFDQTKRRLAARGAWAVDCVRYTAGSDTVDEERLQRTWDRLMVARGSTCTHGVPSSRRCPDC